jgi:hypothetical protein
LHPQQFAQVAKEPLAVDGKSKALWVHVGRASG